MEGSEVKKEKIPSVTFERTTEKDIDAYFTIDNALQGVPTYIASKTREEASEEMGEGVVYLIRDGERVVGRVAYQMKSPDHAYISDVAVLPDSRGRGIGSSAMTKILEELSNVPLVDLVTHPDNSAVNLYKKFGFVESERKENYFGDGEPRIVMTLQKEEPR